LLDIASLVQDHLADGLQVGALLVFLADRLVQVFQLIVLLPDNLLVLKLQELALLFKIGHDLTKTLLEKVNFSL